MKKGVQWLDRSLVISPYSFGLCRNEKDFQKELKRLKVPANQWSEWVTEGADGTTHFFEKVGGKGLCCIVCIVSRNKAKRDVVIGLLVHEAVHIWQAIKEEMRETKPSKEFEACSIAHISQELIEAL